jgi:hypothetical protein
VGHNETSSEPNIIRHDVDPAWAIAQSHFSGFFMRHLEYDDSIARGGGKHVSRPEREILSALVAALDTQISTEIASIRAGRPARGIEKMIVMVVPTRWYDNLKRLALQVRSSPP